MAIAIMTVINNENQYKPRGDNSIQFTWTPGSIDISFPSTISLQMMCLFNITYTPLLQEN